MKVYRYSKGFSNRHTLAFFERVVSKEVRISRYLHNNSTMLIQSSKIKFRTLDAGLWTLDSGRWNLDSGLWTLDYGHYTWNAGLWTLDTVVDCFRTELKPSFWICLIKLLRILWVQVSKDLMTRLFCRGYRLWRGYFLKLYSNVKYYVIK